MTTTQMDISTTEHSRTVDPTVSVPFMHKFKTRDHAYIFDVNSGEILRVDDVTWEIADDAYQDRESVIARYTPRFPPAEIGRAYDEIQAARVEKRFLSDWHPNVQVSLSRERLAHILNTARTGLTLNVTERCNFSCTYCPYTHRSDGTVHHSERSMNWETAQAAIDDFFRHCKASERPPELDMPVITYDQAMERNRRLASANPRFHIGFYGGEPLLNFPLIRRCTEYIEERMGGKQVTLGVTTNGYLLQGEVADFLGAHKFIIRVSVDGPPSVHDKQRRTAAGASTWAIVMDNVRAFTAKYPDCMPSLGATLGPTVDVAETLRSLATAPWIAPCQGVRVALAEEPYPGYNQAVAGTEDFAHKEELFGRYVRNLVNGRFNLVLDDRELQLQQNMFNVVFRGLHTNRWRCAAARRGSHSLMPDGPCIPGLEKVFVSVDGHYHLCEKADGPDYEFGNVFTGLDTDKAYEILAEYVDYTREQCASCWCLPICPVGCYVSVGRMLGSKNRVTKAMKEEACGLSRENMHEKIVAYCAILEKNPEAFDFYGL